MVTNNIDILVVEDNPAELELTLLVLRRHNLGDRIQIARDGEEALDFLFCRGEHTGRPSGAAPKLVLLDLKLPKIDGLSVLRIMKNDARTRAIPVTILTSSSQEPDLVQGYALGANSYVRKPVDFNSFRSLVGELSVYRAFP